MLFYDFGENLFYNETESSSYILEECHEQGAENYNESCFAKEKIKFIALNCFLDDEKAINKFKFKTQKETSSEKKIE